jgi:pyruvate dehydrogenase E2 component (dihydrolipoamide acetyltransferase)
VAINAVTIPQWGMEMSDGTITAWLIDEGAMVAAGDEIAEIETTKIANVLESPFSGRLRRIVEPAGKTVPSGGLIGIVADDADADSDIDAFVAGFAVRAAEAGETNPETSTFLDLGVGRVHVVRHPGDGPAALLIHGFGADTSTWMFNMTALGAQFDVVALDLPGHGQSAKALGPDPVATLVDAVSQTAAELGIARAHLVGHSLGALCAVRLAQANPDLIASLTLLAPAGVGPRIDDAFLQGFVAAERRKELRGVLEMLVSDPDAVTLKMVNDVLRYRRLEGVGEALAALRAALQAMPQDDALAALKDIDCPKQIVWGRDDRVIPPGDRADLDGAPVHLIEGAGHLVHMEKAAEVNRQIVRLAGI